MKQFDGNQKRALIIFIVILLFGHAGFLFQSLPLQLLTRQYPAFVL